jgi:hypothetical protein
MRTETASLMKTREPRHVQKCKAVEAIVVPRVGAKVAAKRAAHEIAALTIVDARIEDLKQVVEVVVRKVVVDRRDGAAQQDAMVLKVGVLDVRARRALRKCSNASMPTAMIS